MERPIKGGTRNWEVAVNYWGDIALSLLNMNNFTPEDKQAGGGVEKKYQEGATHNKTLL